MPDSVRKASCVGTASGMAGLRQQRPGECQAVTETWWWRSLGVLLALRHDFGGREVHTAGQELVRGEEVRVEVGPVIRTGLEILVGRDRDRDRDQLRHHVALQRRDCRLGGDGDKRGRLAVGHALEAILRMIGDLLAVLVLAFARHRHEGLSQAQQQLAAQMRNRNNLTNAAGLATSIESRVLGDTSKDPAKQVDEVTAAYDRATESVLKI